MIGATNDKLDDYAVVVQQGVEADKAKDVLHTRIAVVITTLLCIGFLIMLICTSKALREGHNTLMNQWLCVVGFVGMLLTPLVSFVAMCLLDRYSAF